MKAILRYDEESEKVIARIENCPKGDGTFGTIEWEVGRLGSFMGMPISDEAIKALDGQEMEVKDPEKLWDIYKRHNDVSMGCRILMPGQSVGKSTNLELFNGKIVELIPKMNEEV